MKIIDIKTFQRVDFINITGEIEKIINDSKVDNGLVCLFVPHTTASLTLNENADPSVKNDIKSKLENLIPKNDNYTHAEGNSDSHLKSSIFGASLTLIISRGRPVLGTWQGIYYCEFDGPRNRKLYIKIIKDNDSI
ncbi:MAG: secondary thiamine-phosphate synthase enzyme YjbQ [Actinomycetota bacterium]|jgi:secondary thiamine-phosphate synthase enzyme|nr:secondary thiamine-phosphate synthase enzyme YjbQ [Actinomycetota bacterium]